MEAGLSKGFLPVKEKFILEINRPLPFISSPINSVYQKLPKLLCCLFHTETIIINNANMFIKLDLFPVVLWNFRGFCHLLQMLSLNTVVVY